MIDPSLLFQEWGSGGRWFKSSRPNPKKTDLTVELAKLILRFILFGKPVSATLNERPVTFWTSEAKGKP
jgi:hypothetical protein